MKFRSTRTSLATSLLTAGWTIIGAVALPLASAQAANTDSGPYLGLGWGRFNQESKVQQTSSNSNSATKLFAGYQLNQFMAAEVGFASFGGLTFTLPSGASSRLDNDSTYVRANLQFPLSRTPTNTVSVYAGGGVHSWSAKEETQNASGVTTASARARDTEPMYGVGLLARGPGSAALRLDYELFTNVGTANKIDLKVFTISIVAYF